MMFPPITPLVKNIIILNVLMFLGLLALKDPFHDLMAGYYPFSHQFRPWQIVSHMFMHGGFQHILFNLIGIFFFGIYLERHWGAKRFLIYYMICGLGAFVLHFLIVYLQVGHLEAQMTVEQITEVYQTAEQHWAANRGYGNALQDELIVLMNIPVVGASGALFGLIMGFGFLFPEVRVMLLFPPIPLKARVLAIGYAAIEVLMIFQNNPGDNIAHFAHLGGGLTGFIMLKIWQKKGGSFH